MANQHLGFLMLSSRFDIATGAQSVVDLNDIQNRARDRLISDIATGRYIFETLSCPICDGDQFTPLATRDRYGVPCRIVICETCSLVQTNPYLDQNSASIFYSEIFAPLHRGSTEPTEKKFQDRRKYGAGIASWLMKNGVKPPARIVDVGCSSGGVLQGLTDAGFKGVGIDIGADYVADAQSRGLEAIVGTLDDLDSSQCPDVIAYCQSLEHFVPINQEIERMSRAAGKGTLLYIEVPGLFQLFPTYHLDLMRYFQLAHIWHFSPYTLQRLFAKHGFVQVAGDGYIHALFRKSEKPVDMGPPPSVAQVIAKLRRTERLRAIYPVKLLRSAKRALRG